MFSEAVMEKIDKLQKLSKEILSDTSGYFCEVNCINENCINEEYNLIFKISNVVNAYQYLKCSYIKNNCSYGYLDRDTFAFDFGMDELKDDKGENYYIHCEYNKKTNEYCFEQYYKNRINIADKNIISPQEKEDIKRIIKEFVEITPVYYKHKDFITYLEELYNVGSENTEYVIKKVIDEIIADIDMSKVKNIGCSHTIAPNCNYVCIDVDMNNELMSSTVFECKSTIINESVTKEIACRMKSMLNLNYTADKDIEYEP